MKKNLYNNYDYATFWKGREFEHVADEIAISRLIAKIPSRKKHIIDVGAGMGRITPIYQKHWKRCDLVDSSRDQIDVARKNNEISENIEFICAGADSIPKPDKLYDAAICIRMFHYIKNPQKVIREVGRVLAPGGYFILEIPNKISAKTRLKSLFEVKLRKELKSKNPVSRSFNYKDVTFLNHHPEAIYEILNKEDFEVLEILSASNFRQNIFKKLIPLSILCFFEKHLQKPFAKLWFGPSIYFLARKNK